MFMHFFTWELKYRFKLLSTWVYFSLILLTSFIGIIAAGGYFTGVEVHVGGSTGKIYLNSPFILFNLASLWSYLGMLIVTAVMMNAALRDFQWGSFALTFTKPVHKLDYLLGRFAGAFVTLIFIFSGIGIGNFLATALPILDPEMTGPFKLIYFLNPYLVMVIPNLFIMSALFFFVSISSRKTMPVYTVAVLFFIGYMISMSLMESIENLVLASMLDPMGMTASMFHTIQYWTITQKNTLTIPLEGTFLWNRVLWVGLSFFLLVITAFRFQFAQFLKDTARKRKRFDIDTSSDTVTGSCVSKPGSRLTVGSDLSASTGISARPDFSLSAGFYVFRRMLWHETISILKSVPFLIIMLAGILFLSVNTRYIGYVYGTPGYPVTYKVLQNLSGLFLLFMLIVATFYAGELIWRSRDTKSSPILDALPLPGWSMYLSRVGALSVVLGLMLLVIFFSGITLQTIKGYYRYELGLYAKHLILIVYPICILMAALAIAVQSIVSNKYIGHFLMIIYYIGDDFIDNFGFQHMLYKFNSDLGKPYSDMNGFGHYAWPFAVMKTYWFAIAALLLIAGYLFWPRGTELNLRSRFKTARTRWTPALRRAVVIVACCAGALGGYIYYNTNILNEYLTSHEINKLLEQYERMYKQYETVPQPRITDVAVRVELYPDCRKMETTGEYMLVNRNTEPVDTVYLTIPNRDITINRLELDRPFESQIDDRDRCFYSFQLQEPLQPGETMQLDFSVTFHARGFPNARANNDIVANGTFFNNKEYYPSIGYVSYLELSGDFLRKRHGLEPKRRIPLLDDPQEISNNYVAGDADWINYEAVIGTSSDQIAMTCGHLISEWEENDRRYFHFRMDRPMIHFYPIMSARYSVIRDHMDGIDFAIYYHPGHEWNLDRMMDSMKKSIQYYSDTLSPFQFDQLRIIEFPRYNSFAQSFANTIPYSESLGFVAQITDGDVDYPFGITAHETAHQWWAHQVIGANVQGTTMLSEMLAQYGELMLARHEFDEKTTRKYLRYELDRYLTGRTMDDQGEQPMILNENQEYIHYSKSSMIMNLLQDTIGETAVNMALSQFLQDYAYGGPPYPRSVDLIQYFRQNCPDEYQYLMTDLFERIILYDNKTEKVSATRQPDGSYEVTIDAVVRKLRVEGLGDEFEEPLSDWVEFGVLDKNDDVLALERRRVEESPVTVTLRVEGQPVHAGIDPLRKLIDKQPRDNTRRVSL